MNRKQRSALFALVTAGAAALLTCTSLNDVASGSSSETVVGKICHAGGTPAGSTRVTLYPAAYDPVAGAPLPASSTDTTNDSGKYAIRVPDSSASYTIQAVHMSQLTRALVAGITIRGDTTVVPEAALALPGAVRVILPDSVDYVNGYVFIPGTGIAAGLAGSSGSVMLAPVPSGTMPAVCYATTYNPVSAVIRYDVPVPSGDTVTVAFPAWKHARRLCLNTAASGAGVAGDVAGFPVLIRLTDSTFDFSEALADGGDIRCAKSDSAFLPHEIERWDPVSGRGEVWVRVDTVYGSDSVQAITLYWGNPGASGSSSGAAVFTAAGGFEGVWHLSGGCSDATANSHSGTAFGTSTAAGTVGRGLRFNGSAYARIPGLLSAPSAVTLSAWAMLDTVKATGAEVISIGDAVLIRMDDSWNNKGTHGAYFDNPSGGIDSTHCITTLNQFLRGTGWHHIAYSVDIANSRQSLYIDGSLCCFTTNTVPIIYAGIGTDTYIGRHGNGMTSFFFTGGIDEVRADRTVRQADWIRLCYMNQRADDRLVEFR
jgi:hypothetical protein